ncbi:MAG TPA: hypothetical protein VI160_07905 [Gemmatimonadales bacterium]
MTGRHQIRLVLHGAVVLLAGLLSGIPTVVEALNESSRVWHTAHEALIMMGIWMLAASSLAPILVLPDRERTAWFAAHLLMGYGFTCALILGGIIGVSPFSPGDTPASVIAFTTATAGIFGAVAAAVFTIRGARGAAAQD